MVSKKATTTKPKVDSEVAKPWQQALDAALEGKKDGDVVAVLFMSKAGIPTVSVSTVTVSNSGTAYARPGVTADQIDKAIEALTGLRKAFS